MPRYKVLKTIDYVVSRLGNRPDRDCRAYEGEYVTDLPESIAQQFLSAGVVEAAPEEEPKPAEPVLTKSDPGSKADGGQKTTDDNAKTDGGEKK